MPVGRVTLEADDDSRASVVAAVEEKNITSEQEGRDIIDNSKQSKSVSKDTTSEYPVPVGKETVLTAISTTLAAPAAVTEGTTGSMAQTTSNAKEQEAGPTAVAVTNGTENAAKPENAGSAKTDPLLGPTEKLTVPKLLMNFFLLGWTAFGGPAAHMGYFNTYFVEQFRWLDSEVYAELISLASCLPGPTSTQVSFLIGLYLKGYQVGTMTGFCFLFPGFLIMKDPTDYSQFFFF